MPTTCVDIGGVSDILVEVVSGKSRVVRTMLLLLMFCLRSHSSRLAGRSAIRCDSLCTRPQVNLRQSSGSRHASDR